MNLLALSSSLFATVCLAAKPSNNSDAKPGEVDSLRTMVMKQHSGLIPSKLLVSLNSFDEAAEDAYNLGLALGNLCSKQTDTNSSSSSSSSMEKQKEHKCGLLTLVSVPLGTEVSVDTSIVQSKLEVSDSFTKLFTIEVIQKVKDDVRVDLDTVRRSCAKHALSANSMIAIDVAVLKWVVHAIETKPKDMGPIFISRDMLLALCSLAVHPQFGERCMSDVILVLNHIPFTDSQVKHYTTSLLTLIKFLEVGPIRTIVEEVVTKLCSTGKLDYKNTVMLLGYGGPFVELLKKNALEADNSLIDWQYNMYKRDIHSMCIHMIQSFSLRETFIAFTYHTRLSAVIQHDSVLNWEEITVVEYKKSFEFVNETDDQQTRLFIFCKLKVPDSFWDEMKFCKDVKEFQKAINQPKIRRMIFTYGITILESRSIYFDDSPY